jgi:uroporphyrin-III C-methyltransferase/precorrin-2 dehydrogenase/sirohydrochlorin ferrochelatase
VSRSTERDWSGTLATIPEGIAAIGYDNPVLIALGTAHAARLNVRDTNGFDSDHRLVRGAR